MLGCEGGRKIVDLPQKKYYRQRAHSNPIADHCIDYPLSPNKMDWNKLYPSFFGNPEDSKKAEVEFVDIGCGYGGLLDTLMLGMEIRVKVSDYVISRIAALRSQHPGSYGNIACVRSNAMKYLPNYFQKGQLTKMFFLYPDPHFKRSKHRWRIINKYLLAEYAYVLREGGMVYTVTDVLDLHKWMVEHFEEHPLFVSVSEEELKKDAVVEKLYQSSEEGQKVTRNKGDKFLAVFKKVNTPKGVEEEKSCFPSMVT